MNIDKYICNTYIYIQTFKLPCIHANSCDVVRSIIQCTIMTIVGSASEMKVRNQRRKYMYRHVESVNGKNLSV